MRIPKLNYVAFFLLTMCLTTVADAQKSNLSRNDFKNLAGAAEEFPQMRLPNPADLGLKSKTAMLQLTIFAAYKNLKFRLKTPPIFV